MAVPKKRTSVARKGWRRAGHTHKLKTGTTISCSNCSATVIPHHVCPSCGHYKGKEIIQFRAEAEASAETEQE